jgi:hypothetical protein
MVLSPLASISTQWPVQISAALEQALAVSISDWFLAPPS